MRESMLIDDLGQVKPIPANATKVFEGHLFSIWQWDQKLYDGSMATFEAVKRRSSVHTLGVLPDRRILLTLDEQPNRGAVLTPPGGMIDPGEDPATAAKREFLEETGYAISELIPLHHFQASTKMEWFVYAFIGRNLEKVAEPTLESGERIITKTFTFDELLELGRSTQLRDRILRTLFLEALLDSNKRAELEKLFYGSS